MVRQKCSGIRRSYLERLLRENPYTQYKTLYSIANYWFFKYIIQIKNFDSDCICLMPYSATLKENNHLILEYRMKHVAVRIFATKTRETTAKNPVQNLVIILTDPQFLTMIVVRNLSKNLCMIIIISQERTLPIHSFKIRSLRHRSIIS